MDIRQQLILFRRRLKNHKKEHYKNRLTEYYAKEHYLKAKIEQLFEELGTCDAPKELNKC